MTEANPLEGDSPKHKLLGSLFASASLSVVAGTDHLHSRRGNHRVLLGREPFLGFIGGGMGPKR